MADILKDIELLFAEKGGVFKSSSSEIQSKLSNIKALLLDWDGVFNDGVKNGADGSLFSEVDSMGINMLRFSYYLKHGVVLPVFILTGENNKPALWLSEREHYSGVYLKMSDKVRTLDNISENFNISPAETAFVFDDVLDLGVAELVNLRFFVSRKSSILLNDLVEAQKLADYYTFSSGGNHAVREVCELCIGLQGNYSDPIIQRKDFSSSYKAYLSARSEIITRKFIGNNGEIEEL